MHEAQEGITFGAECMAAQGDDDQIVPFANAGKLQAELIQGAVLKVYKGAPHGLPTTHKDMLNTDLLAFIEQPAMAGV